jgi:hypothetical protein
MLCSLSINTVSSPRAAPNRNNEVRARLSDVRSVSKWFKHLQEVIDRWEVHRSSYGAGYNYLLQRGRTARRPSLSTDTDNSSIPTPQVTPTSVENRVPEACITQSRVDTIQTDT